MKYEAIIQSSYEVEAENTKEAENIAEELFNGDTHPEITGIDVNPSHEDN